MKNRVFLTCAWAGVGVVHSILGLSDILRWQSEGVYGTLGLDWTLTAIPFGAVALLAAASTAFKNRIAAWFAAVCITPFGLYYLMYFLIGELAPFLQRRVIPLLLLILVYWTFRLIWPDLVKRRPAHEGVGTD
jgi:hypothetical protein